VSGLSHKNLDFATAPLSMKSACPGCNRVLFFKSVRAGRCPYCETKICISNRYYRTVSIGACIFTLFVIASTGSWVWTSPAVFTYVMLWIFSMLLVFYLTMIVLLLIWWRVSPPPIERIHSNDQITRMRLDD
jgi:hypothetical protein